MTAEVIIIAHYPTNADQVFAKAIQFAELKDAMQGLATYDGLPDGVVTQGEVYVVDVTFFGFLKNKGHRMFAERVDATQRIIQSREGNAQIKRWDHTLSVEPNEEGSIWTDRIIIDAGWQTPLMARFARYMYTRRHKHRKAISITRSMAALSD